MSTEQQHPVTGPSIQDPTDTATADSLTEAGTGGQLGQTPPDGNADSTTQSN